MTARVYTGTEWKIADPGLKVKSSAGFTNAYKLKVRLTNTWLPGAQVTNEEAHTLTWAVEAPTAPPPPIQYYAIPNIVGMTQNNANTAINVHHAVGNVTYVNTSVLANDGLVQSQNPAYPSSIPDGYSISYVLYNYVTPQFTVPALNGLLKSNAELAITDLGGVVASLYTDETYDANLIGRVKVDTQYPASGALVNVGTSVTFTYWIQAPLTTVPTINGTSNNSVYTLLNNAQLNIGTATGVQTEDNNLSNNATIFGQSPASGTTVQVNSNVNYSYYIANTHVNMINIVGLTPAAATTALAAKELYLGTETSTVQTANAGLIGTIVTQGVASGVSTPVYTSINYTLYVAIPTTTVPNLNGVATSSVAATLGGASSPYLYAGSTTTVETGTAGLYNTVVPNSQSPASGSTVQRGSSVSYSYYIPLTTNTVPNIVNQTIANATTLCSNAGMVLAGSASNQSEGDVAVAVVNFQTPSSGTSQPIGTTIYYNKTVPYTTIQIPNVVGQAEQTAKNTITAAGLNWSVTNRQLASGSGETAGIVYSQSPANPNGYTTPSYRVAAGSTITITVNRAYVPTLHTGYGTLTVSPRWMAYYRGTNRSGTGGIGNRLGSNNPSLVGNYNGLAVGTTSGNQYTAIQMNTASARSTITAACPSGATITYTGIDWNLTASGDATSNGTNSRDWSLGRGDTTSLGTTGPSSLLQSATNVQTTPFYVAANGSYSMALNSTLRSWLGIDGSGDYPMTVHSASMSTSANNYGGIASSTFTIYYSWSATY